jgi:S-adenosylmethionine-diacylgycerolhomoserine-N-methlytransferase
LLLSSLETPDEYSLGALKGYYRLHARIYDWTRPFFLFGRGRLLSRLHVERGERVIDVGCGTGYSFPRLAAAGAAVVGVEVCPDMRSRAEKRAWRLGGAVEVDPRPYGSHAELAGLADVVLFSYSLSMIPPFEQVIERARGDLVEGGRIGVVDFLDAVAPLPARALEASHVHLGPRRLDALRRVFPAHTLDIRRAGPWRYFIFIAAARG